MNCFDCAAYGITTPAVAICTDCGAGLCADHAQVEPRWLTRTMVINRVVTVDSPARTILCRTCDAARQAADDTTGSARTRIPTAR